MERLAHTHEDDIRNDFILLVQHTGIVHYLRNDFPAGKMTLEAHLPGRAEDTAEGAAGLCGDAKCPASLAGEAIGVIFHQHRFDHLSITQLEQRLARLPI